MPDFAGKVPTVDNHSVSIELNLSHIFSSQVFDMVTYFSGEIGGVYKSNVGDVT